MIPIQINQNEVMPVLHRAVSYRNEYLECIQSIHIVRQKMNSVANQLATADNYKAATLKEYYRAWQSAEKTLEHEKEQARMYLLQF